MKFLIKHSTSESTLRGGWTGATCLVAITTHGQEVTVARIDEYGTYLGSVLLQDENLAADVREQLLPGATTHPRMGGNWDGLPIGLEGTTVAETTVDPDIVARILARLPAAARKQCAAGLRAEAAAIERGLNPRKQAARVWEDHTFSSAREYLQANNNPLHWVEDGAGNCAFSSLWWDRVELFHSQQQQQAEGTAASAPAN